MRALIQRVTSASVTIDDVVHGSIAAGMVILLGVTHDDSAADAAYLAKKCLNLRIYNDDAGKMNRSLLDIAGEVLIISQFTLYGDCVKGRRPSFSAAADPEPAKTLYETFINEVKILSGKKVATGVFGAAMQVALCNDGPVTLMVDSAVKR